jgi:hypothetical protein
MRWLWHHSKRAVDAVGHDQKRPWYILATK